MGGAYICTVGASAAYLLLPKFIGKAIDRDGAILSIVLIIVGLYIARGLLSFGQTYLGESLSHVVAYDMRNSFYDHVQRLSFRFHDRHHTGNLMSRAISDVEAVRMFINMGLVRTPYFIGLFIAVATLLMWLDWKLGLVSASFMPLVAYQSAVARIKIRWIWLTIQEKMAELSTVLQENLTGVRVVRAFASEEHEAAKFDAKNTEVASNLIEAERLRSSNTAYMLFTFVAAVGVVLWFGGWRVINGHMTLGELAQFIIYMQMLAIPVRMAGWMVNSYARATSAGERLFEILDARPDVEESPGAGRLRDVKGHVTFEKVSFSYDGSIPVLKDVDLDVEPGKVVALLGAPGSGKTTIVTLIPRFYDASSGRVTIDGVDVRDVTLPSLRRSIGIVQQDTFLFTSSIRENIAYGREDASMEEIVRAARVAQLDGFISSLEQGYDTVIGERGSTLSGGQRQRLSIARAVLLNPPVLILDDSTSSVDTSTEEEIRRAIESAMRGRTTFVVAHRLSTVHRADTVLVLRDGEVVERGTHSDLLAVGGLYRDIYELQLRPQEDVLRDLGQPLVPHRGIAR